MTKIRRLPGRYFLFSLVLITSLSAGNAFADIIIDNGGGGTSSTGTWAVSGGTSPYGANSLWARDGATYTWKMTSQPAGTYEVFMWWSGWSSRATNVPVTIVHRDGSQTVNVNQLQNAGKWNSLGIYYFNGTGTVSIKAVNGSTLSTCADAVRFVNVGGGVNAPPTAVNDSAGTTEGSPVTVNVISNDTDDVGVDASTVAVVGTPASGTAVSNGNGTVTYTPDFGFTGSDSFTYTVADAQGAVSNAATVTVTVNWISIDTVIDNGGPGTSSTGTWAASGATGSNGSPSVWSRDGTKYTWTFTPPASGSYELSMWWTVWSSRSTSVPVDIVHSGGTSRVTINQQQNGGKWNVLGRYNFAVGQSYKVTITSQPGPSSTSADAVKFAFLADVGNLPPTAVNDTASTAMNTPVTVNVVSNDTDDVGVDASTVAVVGTPASGTAVPNGNGTVTYAPVAGYTGVDTFRYTVADTQGAVSNAATVTVTVNAVSAEVVIDNGGPGTSYTGTWAVSGATGSYGSKSVWSRDGATYSWSFTPTVSGVYEVSMWWTTWPSRSTTVPVDIKHSGGTTMVIIDQQQNGGKWTSLGRYSFIAGQPYTVTVLSQPGPSSTCADAVKFADVGQSIVPPATVTVRPPETSNVLYNPGMGFADFHFGWGHPPSSSEYPPQTVAYFRWTWDELEPSEGQYNFGMVDSVIQQAKAKGETLAFRIMSVYEGSTPKWVRDKGVDSVTVGTDIFPDHNNPVFLDYHERLVKAFGNRYAGKPEIDHVDIGSVGCWGEWNTACCGASDALCRQYLPTFENKRLIIDWYFLYFPGTPLVMLAGGPTEYAASKKPTSAGWRGDCFGDYGMFEPTWNHMVDVYEPIVQNPVVGNAWKSGPVQFEVCGVMQDWYDMGFNIDLILQKGLDWHMSVLNAKSDPVPAAWRPKVDAFLKKLGYRFVLREMTHTAEARPGGSLAVRSLWENKGVAPIYHPWPLAYRLRSNADQVVATWKSTANLMSWLPGTHDVDEVVTIPSGVPAATYALDVAILTEDATTAHVELAIGEKRPDRWYPVSEVTITQ